MMRKTQIAPDIVKALFEAPRADAGFGRTNFLVARAGVPFSPAGMADALQS